VAGVAEPEPEPEPGPGGGGWPVRLLHGITLRPERSGNVTARSLLAGATGRRHWQAPLAGATGRRYWQPRTADRSSGAFSAAACCAGVR
jgi:hypothetical protein